MRLNRRGGFTLVELLVVIVIIGLIAALLLPALMKAMCSARSGSSAAMISQLAQACSMYNQDFAVYPPGNGSGSKEMAYALTAKGPKKLPYFEFQPDMLFQGHVVNPVWGAEGEPPSHIIFYRNNRTTVLSTGASPVGAPKPVSSKDPKSKTGPQAVLAGPPVLKKSSFDMWAAGCDFKPEIPTSHWGIRYE
jgi:prepilin-type N-terminal cleavage/methylation domain-containing protein